MKLRTGAMLQSGKYQLNQVVGRESSGATFRATQTLLQQPVVIKTIDPSLQITQSFPQLKLRFIEETRLLARCQHPSIVRVLDFFQEEGLPFLVMEYIPGQTLYDRVSTQNAPTLTEAEAIHYTRQAAAALSVAHRNGLVHRNLRPETIVRRQGTNLGILVGFGLAHDIAKLNPIQTNPFVPADPNWSLHNRFAIDLYSLAATLYYLLSGQVPNGDSLDQRSWSPATKQAIFRGLTDDPQWQLQTVDDWLRLLPNTTLPLLATNNTTQDVRQNGQTPIPVTVRRSLPPLPPPVPSRPVAIPPSAVKIPTEKHDLVELPAAAQLPIVKSAQAQVSPPLRHSLRRIPKSLTVTIATAGAIGLGFGVALRIHAANSSGVTLLHPIQPFAEKEWKGTLKPSENSLADVQIESSKTNAPKSLQKAIDPEADRPAYIPPTVEAPSPDYAPPRRRAVIEPTIPAKPVKSAPAVEPTLPEPSAERSTLPLVEPSISPVTAPTPNSAPVKPSTRKVAPTPPLDSSP